MYLCIVYVVGDPQEDEGNFVSQICHFDTFEEAKKFEEENYDYGLYIDIFKGERV